MLVYVAGPLFSEAERAWLREFGAAHVAEIHEEVAESLARAVRQVL